MYLTGLQLHTRLSYDEKLPTGNYPSSPLRFTSNHTTNVARAINFTPSSYRSLSSFFIAPFAAPLLVLPGTAATPATVAGET
jgi:hypothetical protein